MAAPGALGATLEQPLGDGRALAGAAGAVPVAAVAAAQGGYFPTSWGWSAVSFLLAAGLALLIRPRISVTRSTVVFASAWAAVAAWIALSSAWSNALPDSVLEAERALVYLSYAAVLVFVVAGRDLRWFVGGLYCAIVGVGLFSLGTRLFPGTLRVFDPEASNRLAQPLGYWNGLSAFVAIGIVLGLGIAVRAHRAGVRAAAAAAVVPLAATFYFTFGRTGWVALAVGVVAAVAFDRRRVQLLAFLVVLCAIVGTAVWSASQYHGLTATHPLLTQAEHDGRSLAWKLLLLALAAAAAAVVFAVLEHRLVPRSVRIAFVVLVVAGLIAAAGAATAREGGPVASARNAWHDFKQPPVRPANLNNRLLSLSGDGRYDLWRIAWDDATVHPLLGSGAGTYERYFLRHQPAAIARVRDAHGLYIETLAELGPIGLVLLLVAFLFPLVAAARTRATLVGPLAGAYVVYLIHAASDWDWELPAVTLAALACGGALVLARSAEEPDVELGWRPRVVAVAVAALAAGFAGFAFVGNSALAASQSSNAAHDWPTAATQARRAQRWMPWSPRPWAALGTAQLGAGYTAAARASFEKAVSVDPNDWATWAGLARATTGAEHAHAVRRVAALFPRSRLATRR